MKSFKQWYMEFLPHPDEQTKSESGDVEFLEWLDRTDTRLLKKHVLRIRKPKQAKPRLKII